MKILHRFIHRVTLLSHTLAQFTGQSTRGGDPKFARVCARAGCNVHDRAGTRQAKTNRFKCRINFRQVAFTDPAKHNVLVHSSADGPVSETAGDVCHGAQLISSDIAKWKSDRGGYITFLLLMPDI